MYYLTEIRRRDEEGSLLGRVRGEIEEGVLQHLRHDAVQLRNSYVGTEKK